MGRPIWSVLSEDLIMDLLAEIPLLNGGNIPEPFIRLSDILQEHPNINTLLHRSMDIDDSGLAAHQAAHAEESSTRDLRKRPAPIVRDQRPHVGEQELVLRSSKKRPRDVSDHACCRNGVKVGLRGSGSQQTREERQPCGDTDGRSNENDMETEDTATVWLSDGTPPIPEEATNHLFSHLATINTKSHAITLTSLLHNILSDSQPNNLSAYDLDFPSLIAQCHKAGTGKAARDFRTALLYIRLAIHVDL